MTSTKLEMTFKNELDSTMRLSLDDPRADVTDAEVSTAMNLIVTKNIFNSSGGDLVSSVGAKIVTTDVQELTI